MKDITFLVPRAIMRPGVGFGARILYGWLLDRAVRSAELEPSLRELARELGCTVQTIQRLVHQLEEHNLISVERRPSLSHRYTLVPRPWIGEPRQSDQLVAP